MTVQSLTDLETPIGKILDRVGSDGVLLESPSHAQFAIIPLDDDLLDFLLERSPKFAQICQQARDQIAAGKFRTHDEVVEMFRTE